MKKTFPTRWAYTFPLIISLLTCFVMKGQSLEWQVEVEDAWILSSPRFADFNGDGVKDVVIGGGGELKALPDGVLAINGLNGQLLWRLPSRDQVYTSALLRDLNQDGVKDVLICGRSAVFMAIDGRRGELLWEFWPDSLGSPKAEGWYNFYQPQWTPDLDFDGIPDLLTSNGGDASAPAFQKVRPVGKLAILSGKTGQIIASDTLPDGQETYFPPQMYQKSPEGPLTILLGSGGETNGGSLWEIELEDFVQKGLKDARPLITDKDHGFIAHPAWADLNDDAYADLILPQFDGVLWAMDRHHDRVLWRKNFPGYQLYSAPAIGDFVGDETPDVFTTLAEGNWPFYQSYVHIMVDGTSGQVIWSDSADRYYQLSQVNVLDWDEDGWDEVLRLRNMNANQQGRNYFNRLEIIDFNDGRRIDLGGDRPGLNVFSTPSLGDIDGNRQLDIIFAYTPSVDAWAGNNGSRLTRLELNQNLDRISWSGYLGNAQNGSFQTELLTYTQGKAAGEVEIYPNPFSRRLHLRNLDAQARICLRDLNGKLILETAASESLNLEWLSPGTYLLSIRGRDCEVHKVLVKR